MGQLNCRDCQGARIVSKALTKGGGGLLSKDVLRTTLKLHLNFLKTHLKFYFILFLSHIMQLVTLFLP